MSAEKTAKRILLLEKQLEHAKERIWKLMGELAAKRDEIDRLKAEIHGRGAG